MTDEWSGLADLLVNLIEKYASDLDIDNLPDIEIKNSKENEREKVQTSKEKEISLVVSVTIRYNKRDKTVQTIFK